MGSNPLESAHVPDPLLSKHVSELFADSHIRDQIGKGIIHFSNNPLDTSELLTWEALNTLLSSDLIDHPRLRVIAKKNLYSRGYAGFMGYGVTETGDLIPSIRPKRLLQALNDGCTLVLDRCHSYFHSIETIRRSLSYIFDCRTSANLYASWTEEPGFGLHYDDHDVVALQVSGSKFWTFHAPTLTDPLPGQKSFKYDAPTTPPIKEVMLRPGELVYVPRGYWHDVKTMDAPSLHVSFAIPRLRYHDIAKIMLDTLLNKPEFRQSLPLEEENQMLDVIQTEILKLFSTNDFAAWAKALRCFAIADQPKVNLPKLTLLE